MSDCYLLSSMLTMNLTNGLSIHGRRNMNTKRNMARNSPATIAKATTKPTMSASQNASDKAKNIPMPSAKSKKTIANMRADTSLTTLSITSNFRYSF